MGPPDMVSNYSYSLLPVTSCFASVGRYLADAALWIAMTSFLATFSVQKALDEHGKEIPFVPKFAVDLTSFECFLSLMSSALISFFSVILRISLAELSRESAMHQRRG